MPSFKSFIIITLCKLTNSALVKFSTYLVLIGLLFKNNTKATKNQKSDNSTLECIFHFTTENLPRLKGNGLTNPDYIIMAFSLDYNFYKYLLRISQNNEHLQPKGLLCFQYHLDENETQIGCIKQFISEKCAPENKRVFLTMSR